MNSKHKLMKCLWFSALLLVSLSDVKGQSNPAGIKSLGGPAPALHISKWIKGDSIAEFKRGRIYVIEFWATWCKPCIAGMPHLSELSRKYEKDVTVIGVDILETAATTPLIVEKFVAGMGAKMDYNVALEANRLMTKNWLQAFGGKGIPAAFVVDREGRVAWYGRPANLDRVLAMVVSNTWDINKAAADHSEFLRLSEIDNNTVVNALNPFMRNPPDPEAALNKIRELLKENPGLEYYPKTAHFTIWSLVRANSDALPLYYKNLLKNAEEPPLKSITEAVASSDNLNPEIYLIAVDAYQQQLDRYPWSMDFSATYKSMADLYKKAGAVKKAEAMLKKSEERLIEEKKL